MKKSKVFFIVLTLFVISAGCAAYRIKPVRADELSDNVKDRAEDLDLNGLEDFFDDKKMENFDFLTTFQNLLEGKYDGAENVFNYIKNIIFSEISNYLPIITAIIIACLLCGWERSIPCALSF